MKRNILIAALCLVAMGMQAQVIIKHDGEKVKFDTDELVKMVFTTYDYYDNNGDNIHFVRQSGDTLTFDIDEVYVMGFAEDFTRIDEVKQAGEPAIVYDAKGDPQAAQAASGCGYHRHLHGRRPQGEECARHIGQRG